MKFSAASILQGSNIPFLYKFWNGTYNSAALLRCLRLQQMVTFCRTLYLVEQMSQGRCLIPLIVAWWRH